MISSTKNVLVSSSLDLEQFERQFGMQTADCLRTFLKTKQVVFSELLDKKITIKIELQVE